MRLGSLFTGYGGLDMAVESATGGATPAWFCEFDAAPSRILAHHWPDVPNLGDITTVDWDTVEPVDILTGGFPCQDLSHAGKRAGLRPGTRSGLWEHMAYAIDQLRPRLVVAENVRGLLSASAHCDMEPCPWCVGDLGDGEPALRALGAVLGDLADLGYDAQWHGLRAADVGAPHGRFRVFIIAYPQGHRWRVGDGNGCPAAHADGAGWGEPGRPVPVRAEHSAAEHSDTAPERVDLLPTPKASDGPHGGPGMRNGRGVADALPGAVALLPTPVVTDSVGRNATSARRDGSQHHGGHTFGDIVHLDAFGRYAPAIARWEAVFGRPSPAPTEVHPKTGRHCLSPRFVEWMMGLPDGHVTDPAIGLSYGAQLKALGNGVVPQQALAAILHMGTANQPAEASP